jgi:hypothetical protein
VHPIVKKEGIECRKSVQAEKSFSRQDSLVEASTDNVTQILSKRKNLPLAQPSQCFFGNAVGHRYAFSHMQIL